ncbi:MAG TPA: hypothetical protein VMB03_24185 [Bryobacteraceae bacterium]|nr:hypothetical protein [Bryobacteraceae bacterium]
MIFQCDDMERALRTPELLPDARAHAEHCEACRTQLYLWGEISRLAPQLHEDWDSPELWPRIRATLSAEPSRKPKPQTWRWVFAVAASILMAIVLLPPRQSRPASHELLTDAALQQVEQAEGAYSRSIANLAAAAGPELQQSQSPLAAAYREKLTLLDSAIAELKTAAARNPYNAYLRTELASLFGEKKKTLQDWMNYAKRN